MHTRHPSVLAVVLFFSFLLQLCGATRVFAAAGQLPGPAANQAPTIRAPDAPDDKLLVWLDAVMRHEPGVADAALLRVAGWSHEELAVTLLELRRFARKWQRLSARGGTVTLGTRELDGPTMQRWLKLGPGDLAAGDLTRVLDRAAVLHADIAMAELPPPPPEVRTQQVPRQVRIVDGRQQDVMDASEHWEFARILLDHVRPDPASPPFVRQWYIAIAAYLENRRFVTETLNHLERARRIVPDDVEILYASACNAETLSAERAQVALLTIERSGVIRFSLPSARTLRRDAEKWFRRALELQPDRHEARLRLAWLLAGSGRDAEAGDHLRRVIAAATDPEILYFAHMFLGNEEEKAGQLPEAQASYERAAAIAPGAQSPFLALAGLQRERGDRQLALASIQRMFRVNQAAKGDDDPWWLFYTMQGRDAPARLALLYAALRGDQR